MEYIYRARLAATLPDLSISSFTQLGEGLENIAFELNQDYIVRFSKQGTTEQLKHETMVLDWAGKCCPLPVPRLEHPATIAAGFMIYRKLPGRPLLEILADHSEADVWPHFADDLITAIKAINRSDLTVARTILPEDSQPLQAWLTEAAELYETIKHTIPLKYHLAIETFLNSAVPTSPQVVVPAHNDLGAEHILVDVQTWRITGIIDWGDAALADVACDFGRVYRDLGPDAIKRLLRGYGTSNTAEIHERAKFYARCGLLEDWRYGLEAGRPIYINKSRAALSWLFS